MVKRHPTPWTYEPSGDVDGDPAYDGMAGVDHLVLDADGEQVACPRTEEDARLIAAAPDLLKAAHNFRWLGSNLHNIRLDPVRFEHFYRAALEVAEAAVGACGACGLL